MDPFELLAETHMTRFVQGGFVQGDYVKLKPNALNHPAVSNRAPQYRVQLKEMADDNASRLCISALKAVRSARARADQETPVELFIADLTCEKAPGLNYGVISVPTDLLELIDRHDVPDGWRYQHNANQGPNEPIKGEVHGSLKQLATEQFEGEDFVIENVGSVGGVAVGGDYFLRDELLDQTACDCENLEQFMDKIRELVDQYENADYSFDDQENIRNWYSQRETNTQELANDSVPAGTNDIFAKLGAAVA